MKHHKSHAILFTFLVFASFLAPNGYTQSIPENQQRIHSAAQSFQQKWNDFKAQNLSLPKWQPNLPENELKARFTKMQKDRWQIYFTNPEDFGKKGAWGIYKPAYQTPSKNIWKTWNSRYPYPPVAFSYNLANENYNASLITLDNTLFLALEAPTKNNVAHFIKVINDYQATPLVRLTATSSRKAENAFSENTFPYWEGHINVHSTGTPTIHLAKRELFYIATDNWQNHQGTTPEKLYALIHATQKARSLSKASTKQPIGVHCRTGTFIAAFVLIISGFVALDDFCDDVGKI